MALAAGRNATAGGKMGYDYCISAMHLSVKSWGGQDAGILFHGAVSRCAVPARRERSMKWQKK